MTSLNDKLLNNFLNKLYPIGKTELFLDNEDHSNYMGFAWQLDAVGKAIVGLDTSDTDFNVIGKTGGEKTHTLNINEIPSHNHSIGTWYGGSGSSDFKINSAGGDASPIGSDTTGNTGGGQAHNNLQPYKVFAVWVRIA